MFRCSRYYLQEVKERIGWLSIYFRNQEYEQSFFSSVIYKSSAEKKNESGSRCYNIAQNVPLIIESTVRIERRRRQLLYQVGVRNISCMKDHSEEGVFQGNQQSSHRWEKEIYGGLRQKHAGFIEEQEFCLTDTKKPLQRC